MSRLLPTFSILVPLLLVVFRSFAQTADFTASPASGCAPLLVDFTDNSSGAVTAYNWNLGNSTTSTLQNPSTTYATPGTYTVTLTVTGPGGTSTKTSSIVVYDKPIIAFSALPLSGCKGQSVQFSSVITPNSPGSPAYVWDFGDGTAGSGPAPAHAYTTPGTYSVSLTVTNGAGCSNTASQAALINIYTSPVLSIVANPTIFCSAPGQSFLFNTSTGGSGPYTTTWNFGDGGTGMGSNVQHSYNSGGNFTVKMIVVDANGCVDSVIIPALISVVTTPASFIAPATVCFGTSANFTNNTPNAGATIWHFGDGDSATGNQISHLYPAVGTYNVSMTTSIEGCLRTASRSITILPKPAVGVVQTPDIPCPPPVTVSWTGTSNPSAAAYSWRWKGGATATGQTVSKLYTANDHDSLAMIATTAAGCTDSILLDTIRIRNLSTTIYPDETLIAGCFPLQVAFYTEQTYWLPHPPPPLKSPQPYPGYVVQASWDFGDQTSSTALTPSHTYNIAGTWTARCIITTNNGCRDTAYRFIHTDTAVRPSFTASPLAACPRTPITFINTTQNVLDSTIFIWQPGDTIIVSNDTGRIVHGYRYPGTFNPILITNHKGCADSFTAHLFIAIKGPGAGIADSIYCSPSTNVKLVNKSYQATSQLWNFGDGTTDTSFSSTHTYPAPGHYTVTQIVYSTVTGCTDTSWQEIDIMRTVMSTSVSKAAACRGDSVLFIGTASGYDPIKYSWQLDNVQTPYVNDTTVPGGGTTLNKYPFQTNGYHDVALYITSGLHCFDTLSKTRMVLTSRPFVSFSANPPIGCQPFAALFTDNSTNAVPTVSRQWNFGDGGTISNNAATTSHTYLLSGDYTVQLTVTDSLGCKDSLRRLDDISVNKPQAGFFADKDSACTNAPIVFTSTSRGRLPVTYQWSFGDGKADTGARPVHRYTTAGTYTVRLIAKDSLGCADTAFRGNYVYVNGPVAGFAASDSIAICLPQQIQFTNTSVGASGYLWNFGTGGPATVTNAVKTYTSPGIYNTSLVAVNRNGCTDTARLKITVLGNNGAFSYSPIAGCVPLTAQFTPVTTGIPLATWDFSDGVTTATNGAPVSHTYARPGTYLPRVIYSDGHTCATISIGLDTIKVDQLDADFMWTPPCAGTAFTLHEQFKAAFSPANSWRWNFGTDTGSGPVVNYTFQNTGPYSITLSGSNATGCRDSITKEVFVHPLPILESSADTVMCPADTAKLWVLGAHSYTWIPGALLPCSLCDTILVQPPASTLYVVTGTDSNGCLNTDSIQVSIQIRTTSTTGPGGEICVGESFRLHAEGAQHYEWTPAETLDSPFVASPLATPGRTTEYVVAAREGTCLIDSQHVVVVVHSLPLFSAGEDETIGLGSAVTLMPTRSGITRIEWRADTTLSCVDCFRPNAYPLYTTTYYATGSNEFGCRTTDSVTVHVRCNGSLVFIPNTFTPNGDGRNDYFFPRGKGIERMSSFRVFNRWGELIFERSNVALNDERAGWDGTSKGQALPPDVYVYTMQSRCSSGEILTWKGDVTILK